MSILQTLKNPQGMAAQCSYLVYDQDTLYALDLIGTESAVKALAASIYEKNRRLLWGHRAYSPDPRLVCTQKETLCYSPNIYRWHFTVRPTPADPLVLVYGFGRQTPEQACLAALQQYTPWPARPDWELLYYAGLDQELIVQLETAGSATFAYQVVIAGWEKVLDTLARTGELPLN